MKIRIVVLASLILCVSFVSSAQDQKIKKCSVPKEMKGKYKLALEARPLGESKKIILDVVIKPKNFTKEYMTEFVNRIRAEYCNEDIISLAIFDNKKSVQNWYRNFATSGKKIDEKRGTYLLNRKTGEEGIEYSTKAGNPINEVRIELSKTKQDEK